MNPALPQAPELSLDVVAASLCRRYGRPQETADGTKLLGVLVTQLGRGGGIRRFRELLRMLGPAHPVSPFGTANVRPRGRS